MKQAEEQKTGADGARDCRIAFTRTYGSVTCARNLVSFPRGGTKSPRDFSLKRQIIVYIAIMVLPALHENQNSHTIGGLSRKYAKFLS